MRYLSDKREKERSEAILKMNLEKIPEYYKGIFKDLLKNHTYYGFDKKDEFLYSLIFQKYSIESCSVYTNADEFYNNVQLETKFFSIIYQFEVVKKERAHLYVSFFSIMGFKEDFNFNIESLEIIYIFDRIKKNFKIFIYNGLQNSYFTTLINNLNILQSEKEGMDF